MLCLKQGNIIKKVSFPWIKLKVNKYIAALNMHNINNCMDNY